MALPPFEGRDANGITSAPFTTDSAGHIHASLSWRDYAEKQRLPLALLYSALHLRLCIENLWFEILLAARGNAINRSEYRKALGNATTLYKLIDSLVPDYVKFCEFVQAIASLDSYPHPPSIIWNMIRLKRDHGESSQRFLHLQRDPSGKAFPDAWVQEQNTFLQIEGTWIYDTMVARGNLIIYAPDKLQKPEVFELWEEFRMGRIDSRSAYLRLQIMQPIIRGRR
jgi:hypothetical protein